LFTSVKPVVAKFNDTTGEAMEHVALLETSEMLDGNERTRILNELCMERGSGFTEVVA
jgi:hypothetical protein